MASPHYKSFSPDSKTFVDRFRKSGTLLDSYSSLLEGYHSYVGMSSTKKEDVMSIQKYKHVTVYAPADLYEEIKKRAEKNKRSLSSEVISLVESMIPEDPPATRRHHKNNSNLKLIIGGKIQ